MSTKRPKIYPAQFALAAVAANALGASVQQVLTITDGDFECDSISVSAFDANGALVAAPHVALKLTQGGVNLFANDVDLAGLTRGDRFIIKLPVVLKAKSRDQLRMVATPQPGSTATTLNLNFIGSEAA